jgi:RNA polymerase sigma-70 factor (ECF subfamily)
VSDDLALLRRVQGGDEGALAALYDRHAPVLLGLAMRVVGERVDAEGVLMESFLQAWRGAATYDGTRGSVLNWLATIARSRALDFALASARRASRETAGAEGELRLAGTADESAPDQVDRLASNERRRVVEKALAELQPAQRAAIELAYFEGLTHVEVAERLREPLGTIKTRIRQGMIRLRALLEPMGEEVRA